MELKLTNCTVFLKDKLTRRSDLKYLMSAESKLRKMDSDDLYTQGLEMLNATIKTLIYKVETENEVVTELDKICDLFDDFEIISEEDLEKVTKELENKMAEFRKDKEKLNKELEVKKK